jgi:hypothetical protein
MLELLCFVLAILAAPIKSGRRLEAENVVLRHQLIVLRRKVPGRVRLTNGDRWFLVQLYRLFPSIVQALTIIRPETLLRWHRAGFRGYWRWKSGLRGGRPKIEPDLRALIKKMSMDNPLWGAPRIHGELLKLGFEIAQSSVAKYMVKRNGPPRSCTRHRRHGLVRRPDHQLRSAVCARRPSARPQGTGLDKCHGKPHCRMDCASSNRGVSLGRCPAISHPGPGSGLRHDRHSPTAGHGYKRQACCTGLAVAEWLCRTADRLDPARVCRQSHCFGRGASAPNVAILCPVLQPHQNPLVLGQRCAGLSSHSTDRNCPITRDPWRTSPSVRPGLGFRYRQRSKRLGLSFLITMFAGPRG